MALGSLRSLHTFIIDVPIAPGPSHSSPVAPTVIRQWGAIATSFEHTGTSTLLAHAEGLITLATHAERYCRTQGVDCAPLVVLRAGMLRASSEWPRALPGAPAFTWAYIRLAGARVYNTAARQLGATCIERMAGALPGAPAFTWAYIRLTGARVCNAAVCNARQAPAASTASGGGMEAASGAKCAGYVVVRAHRAAEVNTLLHASFLNELLPKSDGADISYLVFCIIFLAPVIHNFFMIYDPYFVVVAADDVQSSLMAVSQMRIFVFIVRATTGPQINVLMAVASVKVPLTTSL
ncbi:hypothetical protein B0H17DRAFT_1203748 [Mycena rosella]|uniref:Uncharacterized protein n=1 Tax=Mycena rosella TaxID=1033263 RepID=A0AAD7DBC4_MYCRO|nr:hypothetical protein B0H17DRAFT_1203748 [Mycena rosella]